VSAAEDFAARCLALVADRYPTTVRIEDRLAAVFDMVEASTTEQERTEAAIALAEDALREEHRTAIEELIAKLYASDDARELLVDPDTLTVERAQLLLRDAIMREAEVVDVRTHNQAVASARFEGVMEERKRVADADSAAASARKEKRARAKLANNKNSLT
jgi:hypothetical protein